jgi:CysZ protein
VLPWAVVPVVLNVGLVVAALVSVVLLTPLAVDWLLWARPAAPGPAFVWKVLTWTLALWLFVVAMVVLYLSSGVVGSPFYDRLAQAVERVETGVEPPETWGEWAGLTAASVGHSAAALLLWAVALVVLSLLGLIPVVGAVIELVLSILLTVVLVSREMVDGALTRRRLSFLAKIRFMWRHAAAMLGLGCATGALVWIPLLNFVVIPAAVVGGTLLVLELGADQNWK